MNNHHQSRYAYHAAEASHQEKVSKVLGSENDDGCFFILLGTKEYLAHKITSHFYKHLVIFDILHRKHLRMTQSYDTLKNAISQFKSITAPIILHDGCYFLKHTCPFARKYAAAHHFTVFENLEHIDPNLCEKQQIILDRLYQKSWAICPAKIDEFQTSYGYDAVRLYLLTYGQLPKSEFDYDIGYENALKFICRLHHYLSPCEISTAREILSEPYVPYLDQFYRHVENLRFDMAIAAIHHWANGLVKEIKETRTSNASDLYHFISAFQIICPYLTEEILSLNSVSEDISLQTMPAVSEHVLDAQKQPIIFQINAKKRHCLFAPKGLNEKALQDFVFADPVVKTKMKNIQIEKIITVPERVVNVITA